MVNLNKAVEFVASNGSQVERATLEYILAHKVPSQSVISELLSGQRSDGGWPAPWARDYSSLDATCFRLNRARHLGLSKQEPSVYKALAFLSGRQHSDGSYEEEPAHTAQTPTWAKPGNEQAKTYLTATCGFWQAVLAGGGEAPRRASSFLKMRLGADGKLPTFPHGHWLAGGMWYSLGEHEFAERIFRYLTGEANRLSASNHGWMINTLHYAGVPMDHPLAKISAKLLDSHQRDGGSWQAEDGAKFGCYSTVEAIAALHHCGML